MHPEQIWRRYSDTCIWVGDQGGLSIVDHSGQLIQPWKAEPHWTGDWWAGTQYSLTIPDKLSVDKCKPESLKPEYTIDLTTAVLIYETFVGIIPITMRPVLRSEDGGTCLANIQLITAVAALKRRPDLIWKKHTYRDKVFKDDNSLHYAHLGRELLAASEYIQCKQQWGTSRRHKRDEQCTVTGWSTGIDQFGKYIQHETVGED